MGNRDLQFLDVGTEGARRRIAYFKDQRENKKRPGLMWLAGFKSDMLSTKATALAEYAQTIGVDFVRFDYSGHGLSDGAFEKSTLGCWLEEAEAVFSQLTAGPQILIGSSMGGHIALLLLKNLKNRKPSEAARISALVLIAPAWDMTEELMWKKFSPSTQQELLLHGRIFQPSDYGEPYLITRSLIEEGRAHLLACIPFNPECPIFILQGLQDTAVPLEHVQKLITFLKGDWVNLVKVPDGEHRLSRPQDLKLLYELIERASISPAQV